MPYPPDFFLQPNTLQEAAKQYDKFWGAFGKSLKMGIIEDTSNR